MNLKITHLPKKKRKEKIEQSSLPPVSMPCLIPSFYNQISWNNFVLYPVFSPPCFSTHSSLASVFIIPLTSSSHWSHQWPLHSPTLLKHSCLDITRALTLHIAQLVTPPDRARCLSFPLGFRQLLLSHLCWIIQICGALTTVPGFTKWQPLHLFIGIVVRNKGDIIQENP